MESIYKEWYECRNEEEVKQRWKELAEKGYADIDIFVFRYNGTDGRYHREVYVFNT